MSDMTLGMAIELVVAVLLVLTIVYCVILNSRLMRLRADEEVLRATISELITATEIAERAIMGLKATAGECEKSLGTRLKQAETTIQDLDRQLGAGNELTRRLSAIVGAGSSPATRQAPPAAREPAPAVEAPPPVAPSARSLQSAAEAAAERLASYRRQSREEAA